MGMPADRRFRRARQSRQAYPYSVGFDGPAVIEAGHSADPCSGPGLI
jgi:hypothetical protein